MNGLIELQNVKKSFTGRVNRKKTMTKAVDGVSFTVSHGESIGIIGTSGCGKTTILKMITGLLKPDEGNVKVCGKIGMVAQDPYASLSPYMTVDQIVAEPLIFTGQRHSYRECMDEISKVLSYVCLDQEIYGKRLPSQLSGGERQRVSIARALILKPDFLILDEPTSMLDQEVKESIVDLIAKIAKEENQGFLMVTHDISMAAKVCKNLLVMSKGKIVEQGKTEDIFNFPQSEVTKALISVAMDVKLFWNQYLYD